MRKCLIIVLKDCYFHEVETVLALMNVFAYVKCFNGHINLIQIQPGVKTKLSLILFYSFLKQNIKSCNAIETVKTTRMIETTTTTTTTIGPISKKKKKDFASATIGFIGPDFCKFYDYHVKPFFFLLPLIFNLVSYKTFMLFFFHLNSSAVVSYFWLQLFLSFFLSYFFN